MFDTDQKQTASSRMKSFTGFSSVSKTSNKKQEVFDIITVGSALKDIFVDTGLKEIKKGKRKLIAYPSGYKIAVNGIGFSIGGGGTNTAVGFSRMGLKTAYLGKIGMQESSEEILKLLKKERVKFIGKQVEGACGHSIILDSYEHSRTILTFKGPSDDLKFNEVNLRKLKTKWLYLASAQGETLKTQKKLAEFAKGKGIKIAFNPSEYEVKLGVSGLESILKKTDVLILNMEEARILSKKENIREIFKMFVSLGIKIICITNGSKEVNVYDNGNVFRIKPKKVLVKDATGAGDAFASGFVSGLIKNKSVESALKIGLKNSESVIREQGAKNKLLRWEEVVGK